MKKHALTLFVWMFSLCVATSAKAERSLDGYKNGWSLNNVGQHNHGEHAKLDADIDASEAFAALHALPSTAFAPVVVGIVDSGVDFSHPTLAEMAWTNPGEIPDNGVDDDDNGYIDDVNGIIVRDTGTPVVAIAGISPSQSPDNSHGTMVAGVVAVATDGGMQGAVKMASCTTEGRISAASVAACYTYFNHLKERGIPLKVVNNSFQVATMHSDTSLIDLPFRGAQNDPILHVVSAGNVGAELETLDNHYIPNLNVPNKLVVGASDHADNPWVDSNYGTAVDLMAPGADIITTVPEQFRKSGFDKASGTSFAAPHVAGVAAILWALMPDLTHIDIKRMILDGVDYIGDHEKFTATNGRLNLRNTILYNNISGLEYCGRHLADFDSVAHAEYANSETRGTAGDDLLIGTAGDDYIFGLEGNDCLLGLGGNDTLKGGYGNDVLVGATGLDVLDGQRGDDILLGGDHDDTLYGRLGIDQLIGAEGNDGLFDNDQDPNRIDGGSGIDSCRSGVLDFPAKDCEG